MCDCVIMRVLLSILFILASGLLPVGASIQRVGVESKAPISVSRYEVVDIPFVAREKVVHPFEAEMTVSFVSPTGREYRVAAFYNGDNEWVARFSGSEVGEWSYTTSSQLRSLSGRRGLLNISNQVYGGRRGGLKVDKKSGTSFAWDDGSPCFLLGFGSQFLYALDYHNSGGAPNLNHFVQTIAGQGFNHVLMSVYAYDMPFDEDSKLSKRQQYLVGGDQKIYPFWGSNNKPNHAVLNVNYFKRLDRTIEALNDANVVAHLVIYNWNTGVKWAKADSKEDGQYFDYVIDRYQAFPNIVWSVSGEMTDDVSDDFVVSKISRLRDRDNFGRLVGVADDGFCGRNSALLDFVSRESRVIEPKREGVDKPVLSIGNGGYEQCDYRVVNGVYIAAEQCLRRSYEVIFGGAYTTYYWQGAAWSLLIYDFDSMSKGLESPKLEYYGYMRGFFERYSLRSFKAVEGLSDMSLCMSDGDRSYLLYIPKEVSAVCAQGVFSAGQRFLLQWFNTITGECSDVEVVTNPTLRTMPTNPYTMSGDAVLIVKVLE